MVKLTLWICDRFRWLFTALRVDYVQFRALLEVKLTLDGRRQAIQSRGSDKNSSGKFLGTLLFYALMGLFLGITATHVASPLVGMTVVHAFVMVMLSMSLIADFSSVLLDPADNTILQPRPVDGRTILIARVAHVTVYLAALALSMSLCTLIVGPIRFGWLFLPVFLATLVCGVTLVVFGVQVFYLAAMRFINIEKFRDVILYVQIAMTVALVGGMQIMPRVMELGVLKQVTIADRWWIYLFPPTWMAAPVDLMAGNVGTPQIILTILAVLTPLLGMFLVVKVLAPGFNRALAQLDQAPGAQRIEWSAMRRGSSRVQRWAQLMTKPGTQRATFELVWQLASRDRQFKLRTYPSIAFLLLFGFIMLFKDFGDFHPPQPPDADSQVAAQQLAPDASMQSGENSPPTPEHLLSTPEPRGLARADTPHSPPTPEHLLSTPEPRGLARADSSDSFPAQSTENAVAQSPNAGSFKARIFAFLERLRQSKKYLFLLYFACMMAPQAIFQQKYHSVPEAAWIYYALPVSRPGEVLAGTYKVMFARFVLPTFAPIVVLTLLIWGWSILPDILLAACATFLVSTIHATLFGRVFPFSEAYALSQSSGRWLRAMIWMAFPAALGGLHFFLQIVSPYAPLAAAPFVLLAGLALLSYYSQTSWPAFLRAAR